MADATLLPSITASKYFYWPSCELRRPLTASTTDTTVYWTVAPRDEDGTILTGGFLIGVTNRSGKTEIMWVAVGSVAADGLSATVVRGIDIMGLDYTVGSSDFVYALGSGSPVFCAVSPNIQALIVQAIQGGVGTGANLVKVGDGTDADIYYYAYNADGSKPYIRYKASANQWEISNDGSSSFVPGTGAGSITGGDGITVTSGDIDIDVTDTVIFKNTSAGAGDSGKIPRLNGSGKLDTSFITAGALASYISDVTATATQLNNFASGKLTKDYIAYEAVTANDAVCSLPIECEYFSQLTDVNLALGDSNTRRKYAIKVIPSVTTSTLTTMQFRAAEAVNGATTLGNLTISIQTDSASAPSGTAITNGTANVISQATQRTWGITKANRTATWATPPTLTAGTTYWIVFEVAATDATNYLNLGENSSYDEHYHTFTRLTYNLDTASWGGSVTNATPFFWFNTQTYLLGFGLAKTDADFAGRAWSFVGFASATTAAQDTCPVYYNVAVGTSLVANGKPYYLSGTPGAITQTKPSNLYDGNAACYPIGLAWDSTTLKIEKGDKFYYGTITASATTATPLILWFPMKRMFIEGGMATAADQHQNSSGVYDGLSNYSIYINDEIGGSANKSTAINTSSSFGTVVGDNGYTGAGASLTNIGLTYTVTKTGTMTANILFRIFG